MNKYKILYSDNNNKLKSVIIIASSESETISLLSNKDRSLKKVAFIELKPN
jgi:hypothetical protein